MSIHPLMFSKWPTRGCRHEDLHYYIFRCNWEISFGATVWRLKQHRLIFWNGGTIDPREGTQGRAVSSHREGRESGWGREKLSPKWPRAALAQPGALLPTTLGGSSLVWAAPRL